MGGFLNIGLSPPAVKLYVMVGGDRLESVPERASEYTCEKRVMISASYQSISNTE
jgi:hypothetical protein